MKSLCDFCKRIAKLCSHRRTVFYHQAESFMRKALPISNTGYFLVFSAIILFVVLIVRNCGLYPVVFLDECIYSQFSRLLPLKDSTIPGYLYLIIYRITNVCGDGFLAGARILNALFFVAATPFLYLTARRICSKCAAVTIVFLTLLGPINTYTAYFMPESLYFFFFWLFTWYIVRPGNFYHRKFWCFAGILWGFAALVKPHALLLLPAIAGYVFFVSRKREGTWVMQALWNAGLFIAVTFFTKLLFGYFFAGTSGLTVFGLTYTSSLSNTLLNFRGFTVLSALFLKNIRGHALAICLMFGLPVAVAIQTLVRSAVLRKEMQAVQRISFYALAVVLNLVAVIGLFSATLTDTHVTDMSARLYMRYYNFAFPLLFMVVASQLSLKPMIRERGWRGIIAFPIGIVMFCAVYTRLAPYCIDYIENPELTGFMHATQYFYILSGISFLALIVWVYAARAGAKIFIYLFLPLAVMCSTYYVNHILRYRLVPDVYDKAGIFAKHYLPAEDRSTLVIAGSDITGLGRALFAIDNANASIEMIPQGARFDVSRYPGKDWVLLIGDHPVLEKTPFQLSVNNFTLVHLVDENTVNFRKTSWPGVIARSHGLSFAEEWGTWSLGDVVMLEFVKPLPGKFTIRLFANAYGPNVGKEFVATVGESAVRFTVGAVPEEKVLEFNNPKGSRIIKITVPSSVSPKALGLGDDYRSLGIGLIELRIEPG